MKCLMLFAVMMLVGCSTTQVITRQPVLITKQSLANIVKPPPHYHTVYWTPAIDTDEQGNPVGANIEYDVFSSTNTIDWMFEQRTTKTNVFITNSYPAQYYRVGAHYKL